MNGKNIFKFEGTEPTEKVHQRDGERERESEPKTKKRERDRKRARAQTNEADD